jgi:glycosyltransferase involved in cell wall biosynthesis
MRILQVHTRYRESGGEDAVVQAEAELLTRAGHDVIPYVAENPVGMLSTVTSLAMSPWNPLTARGLRAVLKRACPDVVHVHNTWFNLSPSVLAALDVDGRPVVATLHNYRLVCANGMLFRDGHTCEDCVGTHPWRGVRHRCYRGSVVASTAVASTIAINRALGTWSRHVRLFLVLNEFSRQRFVRGGVPADKVMVKPNFVADPGRRQLPPSQSKTVLFVGRIVTEKGIQRLLEAWHALGPTSLELVVIGDGPLRGALERQEQWQPLPNVRFTGPLAREAVRHWMLRSRALVFPSLLYEGQPMTVLEAFAAGLPVLASRQGGNVELLRQVTSEKWLVAPGQPAAWKRGLLALHDGGHVDEGGSQVRKLYEERFTEQTGRRLLEEAYRTALAGERCRADPDG